MVKCLQLTATAVPPHKTRPDQEDTWRILFNDLLQPDGRFQGVYSGFAPIYVNSKSRMCMYSERRMSWLVRGPDEDVTRPFRARSSITPCDFQLFSSCLSFSLVFFFYIVSVVLSSFLSCDLLRFLFWATFERKLSTLAPKKEKSTAESHEKNKRGTRNTMWHEKNQKEHHMRRKHLEIAVIDITVADVIDSQRRAER